MISILITVFVLLIVFQVKHFVIDYVVQFSRNDSMKKFEASGWFIPLLKHANDHAMASAFIVSTVLYAVGTAWLPLLVLSLGAYLFDLIVHFTMDRIKASPHMLGKYWYPSREYFFSLAVDQSVHHVTHYVIIMVVVGYLFTLNTGVA